VRVILTLIDVIYKVKLSFECKVLYFILKWTPHPHQISIEIRAILREVSVVFLSPFKKWPTYMAGLRLKNVSVILPHKPSTRVLQTLKSTCRSHMIAAATETELFWCLHHSDRTNTLIYAHSTPPPSPRNVTST